MKNLYSISTFLLTKSNTLRSTPPLAGLLSRFYGSRRRINHAVSQTKTGYRWRWWKLGITTFAVGSVGVGTLFYGSNTKENAWPLKVGICEGEEDEKIDAIRNGLTPIPLKSFLQSSRIPVYSPVDTPLDPRDVDEDGKMVKSRKQLTVQQAINKARDVLIRLKDEIGIPGIVIGVSIDGEEIWKEGLGYCNIENRVLCHPDTVMRIASISKPITMAIAAKLWEEGKLDIDKPIQEYVPSFPEKTFNGDKVIITPRFLASHLGGIRHYKKFVKEDSANDKTSKTSTEKKTEENNTKNVRDSAYAEMYNKDKCDNVEKALNFFKDDALLHKPGTQYNYTTFGFTLLSAAVEAAAKTPFANLMKEKFSALGLKSTFLDENEPLIYNRASYYVKKNNRLVNAPYVDNSYKWAGGGFLSTVGDLLQFGNAMLYSYQYKPNKIHMKKEIKDISSIMSHEVKQAVDEQSGNKLQLPGFLKSETVQKLWTPVVKIDKSTATDSWYGMGWGILPPKTLCKFCDNRQLIVTHSGGAVGASSVLLIMPRDDQVSIHSLPKGIVISIITNLSDVSLTTSAIKIAQIFNDIEL